MHISVIRRSLLFSQGRRSVASLRIVIVRQLRVNLFDVRENYGHWRLEFHCLCASPCHSHFIQAPSGRFRITRTIISETKWCTSWKYISDLIWHATQREVSRNYNFYNKMSHRVTRASYHEWRFVSEDTIILLFYIVIVISTIASITDARSTLHCYITRNWSLSER